MTWEERRLKRLKELLARMKAGQRVSRRDIEQHLTTQQIEIWQDMDLRINDTTAMETPPEFDAYLKYLKQGDAAHGSGERLSGKYRAKGQEPSKGVHNLKNAAEKYYEKAMEHLGEILDQHPELREWLTTDPKEYELDGNEPGVDPTNIPRLKNSKAHHAHNDLTGTRRAEKNAAKRDIIERAIDEIENPPQLSSNFVAQSFERFYEFKKLMKK